MLLKERLNILLRLASLKKKLQLHGKGHLHGVLQIHIDVIYDGFYVPLRQVQLTFFVKDVGLVGKDGQDELPVDGLSAASDKLQQILCLLKEDECLIIFIFCDRLESSLVELSN